MSAQSFEVTLARLYTDPDFRAQFMVDAKRTLESCDLSAEEQTDLIAIDQTGLLMASHSFLQKRKKRFLNRGKTIPLLSKIARLLSKMR